MMYYIDKSIIDFFKKNETKLQSFSKEVVVFCELLATVRSGINVVFTQQKYVEKLIPLDFFGDIDKRTLKYISLKYQNFYSVSRNINYIVLFHTKNHINNNMKMFDLFSQKLDFKENILVSENYDDCDFYTLISKCLLKPDLSTFFNINLRLISGGGGTTAKVFQNEVSNLKACLCIVDSDKTHKDSALGNTAKKIKINSNPSFIYDLVIIKNVREKENLIPPRSYSIFSQANQHAFVKYINELQEGEHHNFLSFVQFSKGLKVGTYIETKDIFGKY